MVTIKKHCAYLCIYMISAFCLVFASLTFAGLALAAQQEMQHDTASNSAMQNMMNDSTHKQMMNAPGQNHMGQGFMHGSGMSPGTFSDKAFLSAMIPHHVAAVDMANAILKSGSDPQVKQWAEAIIADQQSEIKQMSGWLSGMGGEDSKAASMMKDAMQTMMAMPGDSNPDVHFVSMMISHHAGAVEMALDALVSSTDERIVNLASSIAQSQLTEIIAFKAWLKAKGI